MARLLTTLLLCAMVGSAFAIRTLQQNSHSGSHAPTAEPSRYESRYGSESSSRYDDDDDDDDDRYDGQGDGGRYEGGDRYGVTEDDGRYNGANQGGRYEGGSRYGDQPASATGVVTWTRGRDYVPLTITLGDTVTFKWSGGSPHDVALATALGDCDNLVSLVEPSEEGIFEITPNTTGAHYYACSVADHCLEGQQVQINVVAPA